MSVTKIDRESTGNAFVGTWHIDEMSEWDADYFNMDVRAFLEIQPNISGEFQFGLVSGNIDGYIENIRGKERLSFSWEGCDEMDEASGSGWLELESPDQIQGTIAFHYGDRSTFEAHRAD